MANPVSFPRISIPRIASSWRSGVMINSISVSRPFASSTWAFIFSVAVMNVFPSARYSFSRNSSSEMILTLFFAFGWSRLTVAPVSTSACKPAPSLTLNSLPLPPTLPILMLRIVGLGFFVCSQCGLSLAFAGLSQHLSALCLSLNDGLYFEQMTQGRLVTSSCPLNISSACSGVTGILVGYFFFLVPPSSLPRSAPTCRIFGFVGISSL